MVENIRQPGRQANPFSLTKTYVASPFNPWARERSPAGLAARYSLAIRSSPRAFFAGIPPSPPPDPGGRKKRMYGIPRAPTVTPADPRRIRFMTNRRFSSMYNSSAAAMFTEEVTAPREAAIGAGAKAEAPVAKRAAITQRSFMVVGADTMKVGILKTRRGGDDHDNYFPQLPWWS